jgi:hypothetical protein
MAESRVRKLFMSDYFFPFLMAVWGILSILYAEKLPANDGLGWDGYRYASIARALIHSPEIDNYIVMRLYPSALVHSFFSAFGIAFTSKNIILGFELINLIALVLTTYFLKRIFTSLHIRLRNQLLGFSLFFVSQAVLKFVFYNPVLTDAASICLSTMLLYYFLENRTLNLILVALLGAFTLPLIFYQGLFMLIFPRHEPGVALLQKTAQRGISLLSVLFIASLSYYFIFIKQADTEMPYTLKLDHNLIYPSIFVVMGMFWFYPRMLFRTDYFSFNKGIWMTHINRILGALLLFLLVHILCTKFNIQGKRSDYFTLGNMLQSGTIQGLVRPFITLIAHSFFFGVAILLIIFFWKEFCNQVSSLGLGLVLSFMLVFYTFGTITESRRLVSMFPWIVIFLTSVLNRYEFPRIFYFVCLLLNFGLSRIWLPIGYDMRVGAGADGTVDFPNQKFFMNLGPWMSSSMWELQGIITGACLLLLFLLLYRFNSGSKYLFTRKFTQ